MLSAAKHLVAGRRQHSDWDVAAAATVALMGIFVVLLSFLPWLTWDSLLYHANIKGYDAEGFTGLGDGWVTATAGVMATLVALAALAGGARRQLISSPIAICGLVISGVAGYDLIRPWEGQPHQGLLGLMIPSIEFEVTREPALWVTAAAGVVIAVVGFALLAATIRRQATSEELRGTPRWA